MQKSAHSRSGKGIIRWLAGEPEDSATQGILGKQQDISWMKSHTRLALLPDAGLAVHEEQPTSVIATILSKN